MKLDRSYSTILSCYSLQKPFRQSKTIWKKNLSNKNSHFQSHKRYPLEQGLQDEVSGLLDTQSYLLIHFMGQRRWILTRQPGDHCAEQQLKHCRQRTRSNRAEWGRTVSSTSACCRQPDQGYCQEYFHKRT